MRILGTGIDLVEINRIRQVRQRHGERFLNRLFSPEELAYCLSRQDPAPSLAARFAAKEALAKAFGTGIGSQLGWQNIEVARGDTGAPSIRLHGAGRTLANGRGVREIFLSLSHDTSHAVAQVILCG